MSGEATMIIWRNRKSRITDKPFALNAAELFLRVSLVGLSLALWWVIILGYSEPVSLLDIENSVDYMLRWIMVLVLLAGARIGARSWLKAVLILVPIVGVAASAYFYWHIPDAFAINSTGRAQLADASAGCDHPGPAPGPGSSSG